MLIKNKKEFPITKNNAKYLLQQFYINVPFFGNFKSAFILFLSYNYKELTSNEINQILELI